MTEKSLTPLGGNQKTGLKSLVRRYGRRYLVPMAIDWNGPSWGGNVHVHGSFVDAEDKHNTENPREDS